MTFSCHTATNQSTVNPDAPHMAEWPKAVPLPVSILVENVRTDKPSHPGSDSWGDVAEWDEPAEKESVVTVVLTNGAKMTMTVPDLGDCMDYFIELDGNWDDFEDSQEAIEAVAYTALCDARNEAINKWVL